MCLLFSPAQGSKPDGDVNDLVLQELDDVLQEDSSDQNCREHRHTILPPRVKCIQATMLHFLAKDSDFLVYAKD